MRFLNLTFFFDHFSTGPSNTSPGDGFQEWPNEHAGTKIFPINHRTTAGLEVLREGSGRFHVIKEVSISETVPYSIAWEGHLVRMRKNRTPQRRGENVIILFSMTVVYFPIYSTDLKSSRGVWSTHLPPIRCATVWGNRVTTRRNWNLYTWRRGTSGRIVFARIPPFIWRTRDGQNRRVKIASDRVQRPRRAG